ncbi:MAG TPA: HAD family phosphatase [Usitatibacter sp.]|nr:HAD family phosphatase [Usitatibacter sp.]
MKRLALFDLDNTLLVGDSDYEWAQHLIDAGVVEADEYNARNDWFYERYKDGTLDIFEFLEFQLAPLAHHPRAQLDAWHADFMARRIRPIVAAGAPAILARHRDALTAIVTATNRFITAPIARELGVEHLIATEIEEVGGRFTGRPRGKPNFREGKVERVNEWLASRGERLEEFESWFYSDSLNDLPLLEVVTHPVAVDPDPTLRAHAERHGWEVISLREGKTLYPQMNADERG